ETWVDLITRDDDHRPVFQRPVSNYRAISPGYFAAMEIPILRGREYNDSDRDRNVVIVSDRTAARIWPGENAIGKRIRRGLDTEPYSEVIGVVADTRADMKGEPPLMVYRSYWQANNSMASNATLVVRSSQEPASLAAAVRSAVWSLDSDL